jgi:hypothetical protein
MFDFIDPPREGNVESLDDLCLFSSESFRRFASRDHPRSCSALVSLMNSRE